MLDSWLTLWHWTRLFESLLVNGKICHAFTFQKERLDLWIEHENETYQLAWQPFQNQFSFYMPANTSLPRKKVNLFAREFAHPITIINISQHNHFPIVRFELDEGQEFLFDFRHPHGNVYFRKNGLLSNQFLKSVVWRPVEECWLNSMELKSAVLSNELSPHPQSLKFHLIEPRLFDNPDWLLNSPSRRLPEIASPGEPKHTKVEGHAGADDNSNIAEIVRSILHLSRQHKPVTSQDSVEKRAHTVLKRWQRKAEKQKAELADNDWQTIQHQADGLAIAIASRLKPEKPETLTLRPEFSPTGTEMVVPLNPQFSLQQNLERLYQSVRKTKLRTSDHAARLAQTETDIGKLEDLIEAGVEDLLRKFLEEQGERFSQEAGVAAVHLPYRTFTSPSGLAILVGRNARDNDTLSFKISNKQDWWFHARGVTGSHVILQTGKLEPQHRDLMMAAQLAARFSDAKHSGVVAVSYCQRKYISKPRGSAPGAVRVLREEVLTVEPYRLEGD